MARVEMEIPDPVLVWEVEYDIPLNQPPYLGVWTVTAECGGVVVFERKYDEYDPRTGEGVDDADRAKQEAAKELGAKLAALLS